MLSCPAIPRLQAVVGYSAVRSPLPQNEVARLETLRSFRILDTPAEQAYDDLTRLTSYICGTPMAFVGFMDSDRLWFKSRLGWDISEVPRNMAFCAHTILQSDVLVVSDTLEDERLATCPLATHGGIRFYAGVPLMSAEGHALGTLCAMDSIPRGLTQGQTNALRTLAGQVMRLLESRRASKARPDSSSIDARDGSEDSMRESESHYRALVENTPEAVIEIDEDSKILLANRATESIFGYGREELLGQPLTMLMPEYLRDTHKQAIRKYVETGKKHLSWSGVELPGLHKSGREILLEISFGEYLRSGKRVFAGICRDITERNRMGTENVRLAALAASSEDVIVGKDLEATITAWNNGAERIYGFPAEEVIGKSVSILVPPERCHEILEILEKLKRGERIENYEAVRLRKDRRRVHVSLTVSPIHDEGGNVVGFSAVGHDITEQKRARDALRHSEHLLQGIISSAMDAIISIDSTQHIVVFNKAAEQIFRCTAAEALGQSIDKFIPGRFRAAHRQHIEGFATTGATARSMYSPGTLFALRADGEEFPIEATISKVEIEGEKLFTVILRDVSARLRMEAELRQAQKMEAVGQMAGGIAHEFNNFLGVVLGYCELLSEDARENETLGKHAAAIKAATQHASSLTRQLLAFSRKQAAQPQIVDLNQVIWESHKLLRRLVPANMEVIPALSPTIGRVKVEPGHLQQILINLLVNARDAMPQGGKVVIETGDVDLDEVSVSQLPGLQPGAFVTLSVSDNGCGMNAETRSHIFEPFYTTKEPGKGTGLGLSAVYGIVKNSGGYIAVESVEGRGTTFRIYLPRIPEAAPQVSGVAPAQPIQQLRSATILIVEDEVALRRLLCISLEKRKYKVLAAKDGVEAVEVFRRHEAEIQLVVTDLMMPRMDGFELKRQIKLLKPGVKFLFMSGYAEQIMEEHQGSLEGCAFLEKPFLPEELANKVAGIMAEESAA